MKTLNANILGLTVKTINIDSLINEMTNCIYGRFEMVEDFSIKADWYNDNQWCKVYPKDSETIDACVKFASENEYFFMVNEKCFVYYPIANIDFAFVAIIPNDKPIERIFKTFDGSLLYVFDGITGICLDDKWQKKSFAEYKEMYLRDEDCDKLHDTITAFEYFNNIEVDIKQTEENDRRYHQYHN